MKVRTPLLAGNWKMHKTVPEAIGMVKDLKKAVEGVKDREILLCPAYTALFPVSEVVKDSNIDLGAQNMFWEEKGAYTGEIAVSMLKDCGCKYVIIGHSERRQHFGDTDITVNKKMLAAFQNGLLPIVCVGETLQEREGNQMLEVIQRQVKEGVKGLSSEQSERLVIAYEPIWAIGTGKTATSDQAEEVHAYVRKLYTDMYSESASSSVRILYGGSVKPANTAELMGKNNIDGCLVGGASLEAESFSKIVKY